MRSQATSEQWQGQYDNPIDHIEPKEEIEETQEQMLRRVEREAYREAAQKYIVTIMSMLNFLHEARTAAEMDARLWVVSSAIDHPCVADFNSNTQIAEKLGITKQDYCKHLLNFQRNNSFPPSGFQKRLEARESYRKTRKSQLNESAA